MILDYSVRDSALVGDDACAGHDTQEWMPAQFLLRPRMQPFDRTARYSNFRRHLEKVAAALSVPSGTVPLRSCEGPLVAQSGRSSKKRRSDRVRDFHCVVCPLAVRGASVSCRCYCKSRKSSDAENLAKVAFWASQLLRGSIAPPRRFVVVFE
jgi:hypothetical protein